MAGSYTRRSTLSKCTADPITKLVLLFGPVTNNVLDWSKLESDMDIVCRPTPLHLRAVFESIVHILPSQEDDTDVEFSSLHLQAYQWHYF
jgi:hypothetical protein